MTDTAILTRERAAPRRRDADATREYAIDVEHVLGLLFRPLAPADVRFQPDQAVKSRTILPK
jgi:hypothetical protein